MIACHTIKMRLARLRDRKQIFHGSFKTSLLLNVLALT